MQTCIRIIGVGLRPMACPNTFAEPLMLVPIMSEFGRGLERYLLICKLLNIYRTVDCGLLSGRNDIANRG
jgi:hypothetical protein